MGSVPIVFDVIIGRQVDRRLTKSKLVYTAVIGGISSIQDSENSSA